MANIMITGGSGLIGWRAAEQLVQAGHAVVVYDARPNFDNLDMIEPGVAIVPGDVTELAKVLSTMKNHHITHVLHLAAYIADQSAADPAGAFKTNIIGAANIFDAAFALDLERVVWTSSVNALAVDDAYDSEPVDEHHPIASRAPYGASKFACEVLAEGYRSNLGLDLVGIRPALTFGIGRLTGGTGLLNSAIKRIALGEPAGVLPTLTLHQPIYNRDMAGLLIAMLFGAPLQYSIYNAPVQRNYTNEELVDALYRVCPEAQIQLDEIPPYIPKVPVMDGSRARQEIAFTPRYSFEDGVREMVEFYRSKEAVDCRP